MHINTLVNITLLNGIANEILFKLKRTKKFMLKLIRDPILNLKVDN